MLIWTWGRKELETTEQQQLVVQWLRISLAIHATQVQSLVQEDPTCCEATKSVRHSLRALEPMLWNKRRLQ